MRLLVDIWRDFRAQRIRAVVAASMLTIAVVALVCVNVLSQMSKEAFVAHDEQLNGRSSTIATIGELSLGTTQVARLQREMSRANTGGTRMAAVWETNVEVLAAGGYPTVVPDNVTMLVTSRSLEQIRRLPVLEGTWLPEEQNLFPPSMVLNVAAAEKLGKSGTLLDARFDSSLPYQTYRVVGVVGDGKPGMHAYVLSSQLVELQPSAFAALPTPVVLAQKSGVTDASLIEVLSSTLESAAIQTKGIEYRNTSTLRDMSASLDQMTQAFSIAAVVTMFVAVLGFFNLSLSTIRERTRELAIRRALGSTRSRTFALVILDSLLLSLIVGMFSLVLASVIIAVVAPRLVDPASGVSPPSFPLGAALLSASAAAAAGLLGGVVPAILASRLDAGSVLRG